MCRCYNCWLRRKARGVCGRLRRRWYGLSRCANGWAVGAAAGAGQAGGFGRPPAFASSCFLCQVPQRAQRQPGFNPSKALLGRRERQGRLNRWVRRPSDLVKRTIFGLAAERVAVRFRRATALEAAGAGFWNSHSGGKIWKGRDYCTSPTRQQNVDQRLEQHPRRMQSHHQRKKHRRAVRRPSLARRRKAYQARSARPGRWCQSRRRRGRPRH